MGKEKELQKQFEAFHDAIKLEWDDKTKLKEKKEMLIQELRDKIAAIAQEKGIKPPTFTDYNQGSYAMNLGILPLAGEDYDLDVALIFNLSKDNITPFLLKQCIEAALHRHNRTVIQKNPCVTVQYHKNGEESLHVDFAAFAHPDYNDGVYYLARGKNKKTEQWQIGDPKKLIEIVKAAFSGEEAQQFRKVIKYLKRWKDFNFDANNGRPFGIGLTACALKWFKPVQTKEEGIDFYNDCRALKAFVEAILNGFTLQWHENEWFKRLTVTLPVQPGQDIFQKFSNVHMKTFETKLTRLKNTLDKALEAKTVRAACLLLEKELGPDFPIPPETDSESNAKNLNQAFIKGGLTLTTPNAYEALPVKNRGGFYGYNPFMERRGLIQFDGLKQMPELTALEKSGFIHQFAHSYDGHIAVLKYAFRLKEITFQFGNQTITNDFSKYGIEIIYGGTTLPKVFVTTVSIDPKCPHCFEDGALCLYHSKNFKWSNNHSIAKDIFPLICTWLYFYEQWQLTGIWLGNEAKH